MGGGSRRWTRVLGLLLLTGLIGDQVLQHRLLQGGELMRRRIAPFDPPLFNPSQRAAFERLDSFVRTGTPPEAYFRVDAELGWAPSRGGKIGLQHFDDNGCRVSPEPVTLERREGIGRVLTLGCSFTLGEEVSDDATWVWKLDESLESFEFANLAMSAYGVDQALLRFRRDGAAACTCRWRCWLATTR